MFRSQIHKLGINPVIDPPDEVMLAVFEAAGKSKGAIPVRGRVNGAEFIQTLVKFRGAWRLYINGPMLKSSGLEVGDVADIEIEFDPTPRELTVPPALTASLKKDRSAAAAFDRLTPSRQKEIIRYIASLKSAEAIAKNVERVVERLSGEPVRDARKERRRAT